MAISQYARHYQNALLWVNIKSHNFAFLQEKRLKYFDCMENELDWSQFSIADIMIV